MNSRRDSQFHEGVEVMKCVCVFVRVRGVCVCVCVVDVDVCGYVLAWRCSVSRRHQMTKLILFQSLMVGVLC